MTPEERDDVSHAITQTMAFFDKELNELQMKFWLRALSGRHPIDIKRALAEYTAQGRYAPKPVQITDLIESYHEQKRRNESLTAPKTEPPTVADPKVAEAWRYVISLWGGSLFAKRPTTVEEIDEFTAICNLQSKASGKADAIPPEAWRQDIWGESREAAVRRQYA